MDEYILEVAAALALAEVSTGVRKAREALPKQPPNFNGLCVDCSDPILPARLTFGAITCLECQTLRERKGLTMKHQ